MIVWHCALAIDITANRLAAFAPSAAATGCVKSCASSVLDQRPNRRRLRMLRDLGIELIAADSPGAFLDDCPTAQLIRRRRSVREGHASSGSPHAMSRPAFRRQQEIRRLEDAGQALSFRSKIACCHSHRTTLRALIAQ
jgi:hypothetical protein